MTAVESLSNVWKRSFRGVACAVLGLLMALLAAALTGQIEMLISTALMLEYEAVLTRAEHLRVSEFTHAEVDGLLDAICRTGTEVIIRWQWRPQLHDPNDEMVLEAAVNGGAVALVTFNVRDYGSAPAQFGIEVLLPREAITRIGR